MSPTNQQFPPLVVQLQPLQFKAVLLECLDSKGQVISRASGAIVTDWDGRFLYTCWHVVTGHDLYPLTIKNDGLKRRKLRVHMQEALIEEPGFQVVGGLKQFEVPLYRSSDEKAIPAWWQDEKSVPNPHLDDINQRAPYWHDAVKIPLPEEIKPAQLQLCHARDATDAELKETL